MCLLTSLLASRLKLFAIWYQKLERAAPSASAPECRTAFEAKLTTTPKSDQSTISRTVMRRAVDQEVASDALCGSEAGETAESTELQQS